MIQNEYMPDEVSSPGESLADLLEEQGISQAELAQKMGVTEQIIIEIVQGKAPITPEIAEKLEAVLGTPARFWKMRQAQYQEAMMKKQQAHK